MMKLFKQFQDETKEFEVDIDIERSRLEMHFKDIGLLLDNNDTFQTTTAFYRVEREKTAK